MRTATQESIDRWLETINRSRPATEDGIECPIVTQNDIVTELN